MNTTREQLIQFANLLARGKHSFQAALEIVGKDNTSEAITVHEVWKNDPIVIAEIKQLHSEGIEELMPSKNDIADEIRNAAKDSKDPKAKAALYALYCDIRGFTGKNAAVQINNVTNKVMIVQSKGSDEEWRDKLKSQQLRLIKSSAVA